MFDTINHVINLRISELKQSLQFIKEYDMDSKFGNQVKIQKGLFFVHLYGIYEWAITSTINETIKHLNNEAIPLNQVKPIIYSLALNSDCDALYGAGNSKKWIKRWELFNKIDSPNHVIIPIEVMPTDGGNFKVKQLDSIKMSFALHQNLYELMSDGGILSELVDNRNHIAHGNNTPNEIGARYTPLELEKRLEIIERNCTYLISTFEEYLLKKMYLK